MKSATFLSLRVDPALRDAAESVLAEGETLSSFVEASVRESIERRRTRSEFLIRGMASGDEAKRTGVYYLADKVHAELAKMLDRASTAETIDRSAWARFALPTPTYRVISALISTFRPLVPTGTEDTKP